MKFCIVFIIPLFVTTKIVEGLESYGLKMDISVNSSIQPVEICNFIENY